VGLILGQLAARALKGGGFAAKGAHRTAQLVQRGFVDPGRVEDLVVVEALVAEVGRVRVVARVPVTY
jgi:hypothetical protein